MILRYQQALIKSLYSKPESLLSGENGTFIFCVKFFSQCKKVHLKLVILTSLYPVYNELPKSNPNSHSPHKFLHSALRSSGFGCLFLIMMILPSQHFSFIIYFLYYVSIGHLLYVRFLI